MKDYRNKEIPMLLLGCTLILIALEGKLNVENLSAWLSLLQSAFLGTIVSIFVYIGDSLVSTHVKDFFMYLGGLLPKPGQNVFDRIEKEGYDVRFTSEAAKNYYSLIYRKLEGLDKKRDRAERRKIENSEWYRIYSAHEKEEKVYAAQRDYLLSRDSFFAIAEYLLLYLIFCCVFQRKVLGCFCVCLLILLAIIYVGFINKGIAFSNTVIATDLVHAKEERI